jgi:hypothetical protein
LVNQLEDGLKIEPEYENTKIITNPKEVKKLWPEVHQITDENEEFKAN